MIGRAARVNHRRNVIAGHSSSPESWMEAIRATALLQRRPTAHITQDGDEEQDTKHEPWMRAQTMSATDFGYRATTCTSYDELTPVGDQVG